MEKERIRVTESDKSILGFNISMIRNQVTLLTTRRIVFSLEEYTFMVSKIISIKLTLKVPEEVNLPI